MLEKTIKSVIKKKLNNWLDTIEDQSIRNIARENILVCGGAITSMARNEEPNDFDVYFKTFDSAKKVANYYIAKWNEKNIKDIQLLTKADLNNGFMQQLNMPSNKLEELKEIAKDYENLENPEFNLHDILLIIRILESKEERLHIFIKSSGVVGENADEDEKKQEEKPKYRPVFFSSNAITLSDDIQIITRFQGDSQEIHKNFDFEHTKTSYDLQKGELNISKEAYECILNKNLIYTGSLYPVCSVFRIRKFIERGWTINAGQILKMCLQISSLDLMDINVLRDQLIGVDSAYFSSLINQFEAQQTEKGFAITEGYLVELINKIF